MIQPRTHRKSGLPITTRTACSARTSARTWSSVGRFSVAFPLVLPTLGMVPRGRWLNPAETPTPIFLWPQSSPSEREPRRSGMVVVRFLLVVRVAVGVVGAAMADAAAAIGV